MLFLQLPESSDETKIGNDSKNDDKVMEEAEDEKDTNLAAAVKAPEPNSAFKSFFNSNVSLEALEAEIAASKKQREAVIEVKEDHHHLQTSSQQTPQALLNNVVNPEVKSEPALSDEKPMITSPEYQETMFAISSSSSTSSASPSPTKSAADFSTKISPPNLTKNDHDGTTVVEMQKMMVQKESTEPKPIPTAAAAPIVDNTVITKKEAVVPEPIPDTKPKVL